MTCDITLMTGTKVTGEMQVDTATAAMHMSTFMTFNNSGWPQGLSGQIFEGFYSNSKYHLELFYNYKIIKKVSNNKDDDDGD